MGIVQYFFTDQHLSNQMPLQA